jgi:hypothetical protein
MFKDFLLDYHLMQIRENLKNKISSKIQVSDSIYLSTHNVFWGKNIPSMLQKDKNIAKTDFKTVNFVIWLFEKINSGR